jgi:hypothetical protein
MPALTVKAITKALSGYVRPDEDIVSKLNLIMPRLYALGMWRDLLYDWTIQTTNDYFTMPEHSAGLIGALLDDAPVELQARWHDYRIAGYANDGVAPIFGVVDDGWTAVKEDITVASTTDLFAFSMNPVASNSNLLPSEGTITVEGWRSNGSNTDKTFKTTEVFNLDGSAQMISDYDTWVEITSIYFEGVFTPVDIRVEDEFETSLATVRGDGIARYRRFRFANNSGATRVVRLLLKRSWETVLTEDDFIYLGNLNAIKHGLLGMIAEDNADLERAQYHWTICSQLLDAELDEARGAAKPKLRIMPSGVSSRIPNIV